MGDLPQERLSSNEKKLLGFALTTIMIGFAGGEVVQDLETRHFNIHIVKNGVIAKALENGSSDARISMVLQGAAAEIVSRDMETLARLCNQNDPDPVPDAPDIDCKKILAYSQAKAAHH